MANYISQIYVVLIGVIFLPLYIKYMGAEAYGLIGFFSMLQASFALLDLGLTPTIARETARHKGGALSDLKFRQLYRILSVIFMMIAMLGGSALFLFSKLISTHWLHIEKLNISDVVIALKIMAISVALRWMGGLYRGVITGAENLVWLSGFNMLIATLRFVGVLLIMRLFGFSIFVFFIFQLLVALLEVTGLGVKSRLLLPNIKNSKQQIGWSISPIKPVLKFALTIAFTSSVWVLVTQVDKLVLSGILPLEEYGYFTLSVLVAGGIIVLYTPITRPMLPRLVCLYAEGKKDEMVLVYRQATRMVVIVSCSAAIILASMAEQVLFAWTNDLMISRKIAPTLVLYALGNGFLSLGAFSSCLQYAIGNLRYHLIGNLLLLFSLVPSTIIATSYYGAIGAGSAWLTLNCLYFIFWVSFVNIKLFPGLNFNWYYNDIIKIIFFPCLIGGLISTYHFNDNSRTTCILLVLSLGSISTLLSAFSEKNIRGFIYKNILNFYFIRKPIK